MSEQSEAAFCAACETRKHKARVIELLSLFVVELLKRANEHDSTKLESPEREAFEANTANLNGLTFGTPEYEQQKRELLGDALAHHYARNRHHPEHFEHGVDDMNLIDLVEFLADCKAASERHNDGNIMKSIEELAEKQGISPQLKKILKNTVVAFSLKE